MTLVETATKTANALTIDVEDYFQVGVFQNQIRTDDWTSYESRVERNLDRCLELLDRRQIKATFFVLGWIAEKSPQAIRRLIDAGHEVGSHGFGHQPIWKLKPAQFAADIERAQKSLADLLGFLPTSYRAPCFSVTQKTLWALDVLYEQGIRFDSSIFPVQHPEYGIPGAEQEIHRIALPCGGELLEFPMTVGSFLGKSLAFCGGGWFRLFPYWLTHRALKKAEDSGHPFIFYLHPWELDPQQPRLHDKTGALGRFRHYVNLSKNEAKFSRLLDDFDFQSMAKVLASFAADRDQLKVVDYSC